MTQFPFWPVFWLLWVFITFWPHLSGLEVMHHHEVKAWRGAHPVDDFVSGLGYLIAAIVPALALTHALALMCQCVVQ